MPYSSDICLLNLFGEGSERTISGSRFHFRVVSGMKDRWNDDVLLKVVVFVFAFLRVCPVSACLVCGKMFCM